MKMSQKRNKKEPKKNLKEQKTQKNKQKSQFLINKLAKHQIKFNAKKINTTPN